MDRTHARSGSPYEDTIGFSLAVRHRRPHRHQRDGAGLARRPRRLRPGGAGPALLGDRPRRTREARRRPADVVRTRQYLVRPDLATVVGAVHGEVFGDVRPASTMVVVAGLLDPRWLVEVEAEAIVA